MISYFFIVEFEREVLTKKSDASKGDVCQKILIDSSNFLFYAILFYSLNVNPIFPPEKALPPPNSRLRPTFVGKVIATSNLSSKTQF